MVRSKLSFGRTWSVLQRLRRLLDSRCLRTSAVQEEPGEAKRNRAHGLCSKAAGVGVLHRTRATPACSRGQKQHQPPPLEDRQADRRTVEKLLELLGFGPRLKLDAVT